jgi:hypothetical protein
MPHFKPGGDYHKNLIYQRVIFLKPGMIPNIKYIFVKNITLNQVSILYKQPQHVVVFFPQQKNMPNQQNTRYACAAIKIIRKYPAITCC